MFFESFVEIIDMIKADKYLQTHANYFIKEMRLVAYRQYLESFKSVTIENMARSFGVSADFIDRELSNFISELFHRSNEHLNGCLNLGAYSVHQMNFLNVGDQKLMKDFC